MRVISGTARGCRLASPDGIDTRPTADRVKEAMFSIIQAFVHDSDALDLFAGSGGLGIEALSRGASHCDFVEQSARAIAVVTANLEKTRLSDFSVHKQSAERFLWSCSKKYDLVFLDPPYKKQLCDKALSMLKERKLLAENAIVVCETSCDEEIDSPFEVYRRSKYGTVKVTVFINSDSYDERN